MADLFTEDLSKLTLVNVVDFLGINVAEELRLPEGTRIDFKRTLTAHIGKTVCAFANTIGGLVFIGIECSKSSKTKQNVAQAAPGASVGADARAGITNLITTTVNPRPPFEVESYGVGTSGNVVAVVRVKEGTYPPYEYERTGDYCIPVRVQDTTRQASLREIEDLLTKRQILQTGASRLIHQYQSDCHLDITPDLQLALIVPYAPLRLRLDSDFEASFLSIVRNGFKRIGSYVEFRKGSFYKIRFEHNRMVGIWATGAVVFAANLSRRGAPGEYVGDFVDDLVHFFRVVAGEYAALNYLGPCLMAHTFRAQTFSNFLPYFGAANDHYLSQAIRLPTAKAADLPPQSDVQQEIDYGQLTDPSQLIAELVLQHLRETWGADIDFAKLLLEIKTR